MLFDRDRAAKTLLAVLAASAAGCGLLSDAASAAIAADADAAEAVASGRRNQAAAVPAALRSMAEFGPEAAGSGETAPAMRKYDAKAAADAARKAMQDTFTARRALYDSVSAVTGIPWEYLAAVDQYERTLSLARPKTRPLRDGLIAIHVTEQQWAGALNPNPMDTSPRTIAIFNGFGRDGDGDGIADRNNDFDLLYSMAEFLLKKGVSPTDIGIGIWEYYRNDRSVKRIRQFARIYSTFGTLDLHEHSFILPLGGDYTYRSTWGAARSYGGYRIHEGTDLFAHYGMSVRSAAYGIIEQMGWNRYGGWRVGIRDLNNVYHYYAHLSGFNKKLKVGDVVKPGDVIGWVGSSGYGKPGTQGKFPPHLHYGMYRDNGLTEWSFDPYPYLRKWEREERKRRKSAR